MMRRLMALLSFSLVPFGASASDLPRVVSVNVCTDQLVMLLADPDQILSLSDLSEDPRNSVMAERAAQFAKNNTQAETIALQNPDIVVAGEYSDPSMLALLRSIDIEVEQFAITRSLRDIPGDIRRMGKVLGQADRGEQMALDLEQDLAALPEALGDQPVAAFFMPNGFSLGAGTLSHDILTAAGVRNLSDELGLVGNGTLTLEQVILNQPDALIRSQLFSGFSLSEEMLTHPALEGFPALKTSVDWVCGTPFVMNAIASVREQASALNRSAND